MSAVKIALHVLRNAPAVSAIVSDRVYPVEATQAKARPYIAVTLVYERDEPILTGGSEWLESTVEVQCIASTAMAADELGYAVYAVLGNLINETVTDGGSPSSFSHQVTTMKGGADHFDTSNDGKVFRRLTEYVVCWK
jgi:hypothetical protein